MVASRPVRDLCGPLAFRDRSPGRRSARTRPRCVTGPRVSACDLLVTVRFVVIRYRERSGV